MRQPLSARFRVHYWYALVAIYDTQQKGFVWHQQCPHEEVPTVMETARAWIVAPEPMLLPPLDTAFER